MEDDQTVSQWCNIGKRFSSNVWDIWKDCMNIQCKLMNKHLKVDLLEMYHSILKSVLDYELMWLACLLSILFANSLVSLMHWVPQFGNILQLQSSVLEMNKYQYYE